MHATSTTRCRSGTAAPRKSPTARIIAEALTSTLVANKKNQGWFQSVNVLTGPAQNGTQTVKFQRVSKIIKHVSVNNRVASKAGYEILTDEGDTYFTLKQVPGHSAQTVIYAADQ